MKNPDAGPGKGRYAWGQTRRLAFVEFRLYWEGKVNRADLQEVFGISAPQATNDLREYCAIQEQGVIYDPRTRAYVPTEQFAPKFGECEPDKYLHELIARWAEYVSDTSSFLGWLPDYGLLPLPQRSPEPEVLRSVLTAAREGLALRLGYHSMSSGFTKRWLSPHALAWDGIRWHVRAFCHRNEQFSDFVLTRMERVVEHKPSNVRSEQDEDWHEFVMVRLGPNSQLSQVQKDVIARDYQMDHYEMEVEIRAALLFYLFQRLGLEGSGWEASPPILQLEIKNKRELEPVINRVLPKLSAR